MLFHSLKTRWLTILVCAQSRMSQWKAAFENFEGAKTRSQSLMRLLFVKRMSGLAMPVWNSSNRRDSEGCVTSLLVLLSKHYDLVQASKRDVAKGEAVLQVEIWPYRWADFTVLRLDECCFSSTPASSLCLPTPSSLPCVGFSNYMMPDCSGSANPKKSCDKSARPAGETRATSQRGDAAASSPCSWLCDRLGFCSATEPKFLYRNLNVVTACVCPQYKCIC